MLYLKFRLSSLIGPCQIPRHALKHDVINYNGSDHTNETILSASLIYGNSTKLNNGEDFISWRKKDIVRKFKVFSL